MNIEMRLADLVRQEVKLAGNTPPQELHPDMVLADTGLDSLGFATLVVAMERDFGLDPFGGSDDIIYPETFGELVILYNQESEFDGGDRGR